MCQEEHTSTQYFAEFMDKIAAQAAAGQRFSTAVELGEWATGAYYCDPDTPKDPSLFRSQAAIERRARLYPGKGLAQEIARSLVGTVAIMSPIAPELIGPDYGTFGRRHFEDGHVYSPAL